MNRILALLVLVITTNAFSQGIDRVVRSKYQDKKTLFRGNDGGIEKTTGVIDWQNGGNWGLGGIDERIKATLSVGRGDANFALTTNVSSNYYLGLGGGGNSLGSQRLIGFGFLGAANTYFPAYMGYIETNNSGQTTGDLIFATRSATTDVEPTERLRIANDGVITMSKATIQTSDDAKITLNDDGGGADEYRILTDPTNGFRLRNETGAQTFLTHQADGDLFLGNSGQELRFSGITVKGVSSATISGGSLTITTSTITVSGEGGAADDLDTITPCINGAEITLRRGTGTITVVETGNIRLDAAGNFVMGSVFDRIKLECDGTNWSELSRSDNG